MTLNLFLPLDYIILGLGSLIIIVNFWRGFIASILGLTTWIISIIITIYFFRDLSKFIDKQLLKINVLQNYEQITNLISTIISIPLIFLVTLFILKKIKNIFSSDIDKQILGVFLDKIFGLIFGCLFNYVIISTIIYATDNLEILNFVNSWLIKNSYIFDIIKSFNLNLITILIGQEIDITN